MVKLIPALPQEPAFGLPSTKKDICAYKLWQMQIRK
jgi:hypothetical protein